MYVTGAKPDTERVFRFQTAKICVDELDSIRLRSPRQHGIIGSDVNLVGLKLGLVQLKKAPDSVYDGGAIIDIGSFQKVIHNGFPQAAGRNARLLVYIIFFAKIRQTSYFFSRQKIDKAPSENREKRA